MAFDFWNSILGRQQEEKPPTTVINEVPVQYQAFGSAGTEIFSGYLDEEYLATLKGKERAIIFDKMRRSDAVVKMILMAIKLPVLSAHHEFEPIHDMPEGMEAEAEWQQKFFEQVFYHDLDKSMTGILAEILTMNDFAYSLFEMVHKVVLEHEELGPYIGLEAFGWRSPKTIEKFNVDRNGKLVSVHQQAQGDLGRFLDIPAEFLVHFQPMMEGADYEGIGMLRPIYGAYTRKNVFLKLLAAGVEKYAIPTPIGTIPSGKETSPERSLFEAVLQKYVSHQANYMIKPEGWLLESNEVTFNAQQVRGCIDAENMEMANSILAGFLLLSQGGSGGSRALSEDLSGFFGATVQFVADHIEEVLNRKVLTSLVKLNRPNAKLLVNFKIDSVKDSAEKDLPNIIKTLKDAGVMTPDEVLEKYLREKYKLPAMDVDTARVDEDTTGVVGAPAAEGEGVSPPEGVEATKGNVTAEQDKAGTTKAVALNGAQVTAINQLVKDVAMGQVPVQSAIAILILAFGMTPEEAKSMINPAVDFDPDPLPGQEAAPTEGEEDDEKPKDGEAPPESEGEEPDDDPKAPKEREEEPKEPSPKKKQFATPRGKSLAPELIRKSEKQLQDIFSEGLSKYADQLIARMMKKDSLSAASKAARDVPTPYLNKVLNQMARMYKEAQGQVEEETGTLLHLCRLTHATDMRFADADDLPPAIKKKLEQRAQFLLDTQYADTEKAIGLAWQANLDGAPTDAVLEQDLNDAKDKFIAGPVVNVGPSVLSAEVVNGARLDAGKELEAEDLVESYTYVAIDDEKTTDICLELNGHTFEAGDPNIDRFGPPQHHNCRSHYDINMKSFRDNPDVTKGGVDLSPEAKSQITLSAPKSVRLL